jgi:ATP-dependent helicase/nuclease subunit A
LVDTSIAERKNSTTTCEQKFDGFYDIISKKFEKSNLVKKNSVTQIMAEEEHYNISDFSTKTTDKNGDDDFLLIGTAYHNIMEQLDFKNPNILEQIESLVVQNKIDVNNLKLIDTERIAIASKMLGKLIDQNDIVLKEQQFLSYMPASGLVRTQKTDKILVQGVADLIVIKQNEIYLVDYKTSRLSSEQSFKEKYSTQLNIYAKAIEDFYGKKVTKKIVYSFYLNKTIII